MNGEIGFVPGSQIATIDEDFSRTGMQCTWLFCYFLRSYLEKRKDFTEF